MDMLFGLALLGVIAFVTWVGYLAYHEGLKIETGKRHGEAWLQWFGEASTPRFQPGFVPAACAGLTPAAADASTPTSASASAVAGNTWGACFKSLTQNNGPWAAMVNPFSGAQVGLVVKCDKSDLTVAGQYVLEKLTPTPPGSPLPVVSSPLADNDLLDSKIQLRLTLCDKGGDPIRIGEVEF